MIEIKEGKTKIFKNFLINFFILPIKEDDWFNELLSIFGEFFDKFKLECLGIKNKLELELWSSPFICLLFWFLIIKNKIWDNNTDFFIKV